MNPGEQPTNPSATPEAQKQEQPTSNEEAPEESSAPEITND